MTGLGSGPATVLVTGGYGRIGSRIVQDLRSRGHRAVLLVRRRAAQASPDDIAVDLTDSGRVQRAVAGSGASALLHLASVLRGDDLEAANERIDRAVTGAVRSAGIRHVVHASSGAVYGTTVASARTEDSALDDSTSYARSKLRAEQLFAELSTSDAAVSVTSLRIFNVAGPDFPDSLVQRLIRADPRQPVTVVGPDRFVRDFIHQEDLVDVLRAALEACPPGHRVVNVGAGVPVTTRVLLERIEPDPAAIVEVAGELNINWADISQMLRLFGVRPRAVPDRSWDRRGPADSRLP